MLKQHQHDISGVSNQDSCPPSQKPFLSLDVSHCSAEPLLFLVVDA